MRYSLLVLFVAACGSPSCENGQPAGPPSDSAAADGATLDGPVDATSGDVMLSDVGTTDIGANDVGASDVGANDVARLRSVLAGAPASI